MAFNTVDHLPARTGQDDARAVRFESARPLGAFVRGPWIKLSGLIPVEAWPAEVVNHYLASQRVRALGNAPPAAIESTRGLHFGSPRGRKVRSIWCGGHALLFHSAKIHEKRTGVSGTGPTRRFFDLAVIDIDDATDRGREVPLIDVVEAPLTDRLPFAAAAIDDQVLLVYITSSAIIEQRGRVTAAGLELDEATALGPFEGRVGDLHLLATPEAFHLVWSEGRDREYDDYRLLYRRKNRDGRWESPRTLTESANSGTANLLVDGDDIFVAWSDHRFREWRWVGYEKTHKIFVQRGSRHGRQFGRPTLMSDPDDRYDEAERLFLAASQDEIVIYWSLKNVGARWHRAAVDRALTTVTPLDDLDHASLMQDYTARLRLLAGEGPLRQAAAQPPIAD